MYCNMHILFNDLMRYVLNLQLDKGRFRPVAQAQISAVLSLQCGVSSHLVVKLSNWNASLKERENTHTQT